MTSLARKTMIGLVCALSLTRMVASSSERAASNEPETGATRITQDVKARLAGREGLSCRSHSGQKNLPLSLGYQSIVSNSPGLQVGLTSYDLQAYGRATRQVEWRSTQLVHFAWTKKYDFVFPGERGTGYEGWDTDDAAFIHAGTGGGCDIHTISSVYYSSFQSIDVDTEGKAIIANHYRESPFLASTIWYDFYPGACHFSIYRSMLPDSIMMYGCNEDDILDDFWHFILPSMAYQVYDGDTITHVFAIQYYGELAAERGSFYIHYFRRVGSDTLGHWEYPPMIVDTVSVSAYHVEASRNTGKVALVWLANPGGYPRDPESVDRYEQQDSCLGWSGRYNDIFYMTSDDMGVTWNPKVNLTGYDSTQGGWVGGCDLSTLIDSNDKLHIVWNARETVPCEGCLGDWTHFYGGRIFHWDEYYDEIRTVKDANWPVTDPATLCLGGQFNYMWVVKPMISECEGKFYVVFVQFHDIPSGLIDDCAQSRYTGGDPYYSANGELYLAVSDNGGYNWDIARNLTNTVTPRCFPDESEGTPVCEADQYPSMPRFGMEVTDPSAFMGVPIVDPSGGEYEGNHYLDVFYINDKYPGMVWGGDGVWTMNPMKWFRVPCIDPVPNAVLSYHPDSIGLPAYTGPGIQLDTALCLENIGNTELYVSAINVIELSGAGWLGVSNSGPLTISHMQPNSAEIEIYLNEGGNITTSPHNLEGYIEIVSDAVGGSVDSVYINLIIADTIQFPEDRDIRTSCIRVAFNNAGNLGKTGGDDGDGGYNMNFFNDCDTAGNTTFDHNHSGIYLYDGSPFIARIKGTDTIFNHGMCDAGWLSDDGFRPFGSIIMDSMSFPDYHYGRTGEFVSKDSTIALECEYFAPTASDSCSFFVSRLTVHNDTEDSILGVYIGDVMDWDIPADQGARNGTGCDATRQLIYCYGAEYHPEAIDNDNCVLSDQRYGGLSYYGGYHVPLCTGDDSIPHPQAMWTRMNADYVYPTSGFVAGEMYTLLNSISGYSPWEATYTEPLDSQYQDLHMVTVCGQYDLGAGDTLVFIRILVSEYDGGLGGLQVTVDRARAWIDNRPDVFRRPLGDNCVCCNEPGDADNNDVLNILDVTYIINYLYKNGPEPVCPDEADPDRNCAPNILDVTYIINYLYKNGPPPECGCVGG